MLPRTLLGTIREPLNVDILTYPYKKDRASVSSCIEFHIDALLAVSARPPYLRAPMCDRTVGVGISRSKELSDIELRLTYLLPFLFFLPCFCEPSHQFHHVCPAVLTIALFTVAIVQSTSCSITAMSGRASLQHPRGCLCGGEDTRHRPHEAHH